MTADVSPIAVVYAINCWTIPIARDRTYWSITTIGVPLSLIVVPLVVALVISYLVICPFYPIDGAPYQTCLDEENEMKMKNAV